MAEKDKTAGTEIAVLGDRYPVLYSEGRDTFAAVLEENFGDEQMRPSDLERIKMPAGGGLAWEVPTIDGPEPRKVLEGVIVTWQSPRTYWEEGFSESGGGNPPDCSSDEGKIGRGEYGPGSEGNPSGACVECPMNQWGSDGGKGKACKEQRMLFMLMEGGVLPVTINLPPTSIQPLRKYMLRLASSGVPYYGVVTKLGLEKVSGQYTYSVAKPELGPVLSAQEREAAKEYGESLKKSLASLVPGEVANTAAQAYEESVS